MTSLQLYCIPGLAEIKTYVQKMQDVQVTKSLEKGSTLCIPDILKISFVEFQCAQWLHELAAWILFMPIHVAHLNCQDGESILSQFSCIHFLCYCLETAYKFGRNPQNG